MTQALVDTSKVAGWGVDADPENDPTYPYRERESDDHSGRWERPPLQRSDVEILSSVEHKRLPAVFGTSTPPVAVSGMLRRIAFRYTESHWAHWLLLMGADRINVVEGVVQDLGRGRIPNIPVEMGIRSEWRHNKRGLARKAAIAAAVTGTAVFLLRRRRNRDAEDASDAETNQAAA